MEDIVVKVIQADFHDPFQVLGVHFHGTGNGIALFRTLQPHATSVDLLFSEREVAMKKNHDGGLFEIEIDKVALADPNLAPFSYQYRITYHNGVIHTINDPYRFLPQLDSNDSYLFNFGTNYRLYDHLGAHLSTIEHITGTVFRVWAPSAKRVSVLGDFNGWDGRVHAMRSLGNSGIWELFIPGVLEDIAHCRGPQKYLFLLGYAGWGPGQIEQELLNDGWLIVPGSDEIIFDTPDQKKWRAAALQYGIDISIYGDEVGRA